MDTHQKYRNVRSVLNYDDVITIQDLYILMMDIIRNIVMFRIVLILLRYSTFTFYTHWKYRNVCNVLNYDDTITIQHVYVLMKNTHWMYRNVLNYDDAINDE